MIVIPSLHTADEVIARVSELRSGRVQRALDVVRRVGGKPVNIARFIACMGGSVHLCAVVDAALGDRLKVAADDPLLGGRLAVELIRSPVDSRSDVAIVDDTGGLTVVNGQAASPGQATIDHMIDSIRATLGPSDVLVLAGSLPAKVAPGLLADLVHLGRAVGATMIVDTSGPPLVAALAAAPDIVRVTARELAEARGEGGVVRAWRAGRQLAPEPKALIVSRGSRGARAWLETGTYRFRAPVQSAVNPLGAGDAMTAGLAATLAAGGSITDGIIAGCGWAAAEVLELDLVLDPERARALAGEVMVRRSGP